jgi:ADP-ribose pyrophosphatase YjhB (NUDIX family)
MESHQFKYCPFCGQELIPFHDHERQRQRCTVCDRVHYRNPTVGVAVILLSEEGLWLGERQSGGWCIPCGHVEWDESIEDAALREMLEETGLHVRIGEVFAVHSNFHNPQQHTVGVWFCGEVDDFSQASPGGDLINLRPFSLSEIPALRFPTDELVVEKLRVVNQ